MERPPGTRTPGAGSDPTAEPVPALEDPVPGVDEEQQKEPPIRTPGISGMVRRLGAVWLLLAMLACVPVAAWWVAWIVDIPDSGASSGATAFGVADDFGVFYTSGLLVVEGETGVLYDIEAFRVEFTTVMNRPPQSNTAFANAPAFALLMAPFSVVPWETAWAIWTVLGIGALALGLRFLGVRRAALGAVVLLLSFPAFLAVNSGQSTFFWFCLVSAIVLAFKADARLVGGALAGLLILKPPLALGFGLWWLIDRRMHRTLIAAASSAVVVVVVSLPFVGKTWLEYPAAIFRFADMHASTEAQTAQFSPWGFTDLLFPGHQALAASVGVASSVVAVLAFIMFFRRHRDEWPLLFAASIFATLWISPHVLPYDWTLLAISLILLWQARGALADSWIRAGIVLALVSLWSLPIAVGMTRELGWAIQIAVPTLGLVAWFIARELRGPTPSQTAASPTLGIQG